jgi:hypothetical protein
MSGTPAKTLEDLPLSAIRADARAQPRAALDITVVADYRDAMLGPVMS